MFRPSTLVALALVACSSEDPEPAEPSAEPVETSPRAAVCGDGELDANEACDEGTANGADANCLESCTFNPEQRFVVPIDDLVLRQTDTVAAVGEALAGEGAWGTAPADTNGDGLLKFELTIDTEWPTFAPALLDLTVGEIAEISFHTHKSDFQDGDDYYLVLYTEPDGVDDADSWYGHRLTGLPHLARQLDAPPDTWNRWSTVAGANQLVFADQPTTGSFSDDGLPTLPELAEANAFDWSGVIDGVEPTAIDYGAERVKYIAIHTLSDDAVLGFDGLVDLVRIDRTDGRALVLDLEPAAR